MQQLRMRPHTPCSDSLQERQGLKALPGLSTQKVQLIHLGRLQRRRSNSTPRRGADHSSRWIFRRFAQAFVMDRQSRWRGRAADCSMGMKNSRSVTVVLNTAKHVLSRGAASRTIRAGAQSMWSEVILGGLILPTAG